MHAVVRLEPHELVEIKRQRMLAKLDHQLNTANIMSNQARDIRRQQKWIRVAAQIEMDIESVKSPRWRP